MRRPQSFNTGHRCSSKKAVEEPRASTAGRGLESAESLVHGAGVQGQRRVLIQAQLPRRPRN